MIGLLALIAAAVFTGAALYVNFVEQPARLTLDDRALLAEWKPSYKHGFAMQAPLALIGANWPWTLLGIMPTNNVLLQTDVAAASPQTRELIVKWGGLHGVRSALGALATLAFLIGCISR